MKLPSKTLAGFAVALITATMAISAHASSILYNNRATFEAAITNEVTDTFNSTSYLTSDGDGMMPSISAADMKALSNASIGYQSTGWFPPDYNFVNLGMLCWKDWSCSGSGEILLNDTTIGTSSGVYGFGLDIMANLGNPYYFAYITFGDDSTLSTYLPTTPSFWGLTSTSLIKTVQFGLPDGDTSRSGNFRIDNVSIGNNPNAVPEPATLALFGLGILGLGITRKRRK